MVARRKGDDMALSMLAERLKEERVRVGMDQRAMAAVGGVSRNSQLAYEAGRTPPTAEYLIALQANGVDVSYLFTGKRLADRSNIVGLTEASEADWVQVPTFDLTQLHDGDKGEPLRSTPIRRDWLNRTLGRTKGLWLTAMPCDYPPQRLVDGEKVLCQDITAAELHERQLCIFRELSTSRLLVGRFSIARPESIHIDADGEYWINRIALSEHAGAPELMPIGLILGRPIERIR